MVQTREIADTLDSDAKGTMETCPTGVMETAIIGSVGKLNADSRLETSPYMSRTISLRFGGGTTLTIHGDILHKAPKFASLCDSPAEGLDLQHISGDAGHVLVHHLYTGTYQNLMPKGPSPPGNGVARFKTSMQVYVAARVYEISSLEELAKEQIKFLGDNLDMLSILDVVENTYPTPVEDDTWFPEYIRSRIEAAFKDPTALLALEFSDTFGSGISIAKLLLKTVVELYCKKVESLQNQHSVASSVGDKRHTPTTDSSNEPDSTRLSADVSVVDMKENCAELLTPGPSDDCKYDSVLEAKLAEKHEARDLEPIAEGLPTEAAEDSSSFWWISKKKESNDCAPVGEKEEEPIASPKPESVLSLVKESPKAFKVAPGPDPEARLRPVGERIEDDLWSQPREVPFDSEAPVSASSKKDKKGKKKKGKEKQPTPASSLTGRLAGENTPV